MQHRTIYRINDPAGGDGYVQLLAVDGVSYPVTPDTRLFINGREYMALRSQVEITTDESGLEVTGVVATTITVVPNDRS